MSDEQKMVREQRSIGKRSMLRTWFLCVWAFVLAAFLVSCGSHSGSRSPMERVSPDRGSEGTDAGFLDGTEGSDPDGEEGGAPDGREEGSSSGPVQGVQFAEGFGICASGQPPVYTMESPPPPIETEGAKAWLQSVAYQNGIWIYRVKVEDHSITVIPEDEVEELLKKEEENMKLQEEGKYPQWDNSYFELDHEKGIYGRSSFEERTGFRKTKNGLPGEHFIDSIQGPGVPGGSISARRHQRNSRYEEYLTKGYAATYWDYYVDQMELTIPEPDGIYELHIPGFSEGFLFSFVKAHEYPSAEEIPGMVFHQGMGIYATGKWTEDGFQAAYYTYPKEGYVMQPVIAELSFCKGDQKGTGHLRETEFDHSLNAQMGLQGIPDGKQGQIITYELDPEAGGGEIWLKFDRVNMAYQKEIQWLTIPIPEEKTEVDQTFSLDECTVKVVSARRTDSPVYYGNINGVDETRPAVYVETEIEMNDDGKEFSGLYALMEEEIRAPYPVLAKPVYKDEERIENHEKPLGYNLCYSKGDTQVQLGLKGVYYNWHQEFMVPVQVAAE